MRDGWLFTLRVHRRGHATDDLPRAARANPCVRDPQSVGPDLATFAIGPRCIDSIVIDRDIAGDLNRQWLDCVRLQLHALGGVCGDPISDVIFPCRR